MTKIKKQEGEKKKPNCEIRWGVAKFVGGKKVEEIDLTEKISMDTFNLLCKCLNYDK